MTKVYNLDSVFERLNSSKEDVVSICQQILLSEMSEDVESVIISCSRENEGFSPSQNAKEILEIASKMMDLIACISDAKVRNPYIEG